MSVPYVTYPVQGDELGDTLKKINQLLFNSSGPVTYPITPDKGGTGKANDPASTQQITGAFGITWTVTGATALTLPTSGTLVTTTTLNNATLAASLTTVTASTQIIVPDGSAGTPAIKFNSDCGILAGSGRVDFEVAGAVITSIRSTQLVLTNGHFIAFGATNAFLHNNGNNVQIGGGGSGNTGLEVSDTSVRLGPGLTANVGGTIFDDFTDAATTHTDGTEDTLYTHTLQASQFSANGDKIAGVFQLAIVGHAVSTDRIRLYVAGTAIFDTTALNFPLGAQLTLDFEVIRVSATVLRASVAASTSSATVIAYSQYVEITGLTLSNTQIVALKAIATGTNSAAGDVTAKLGTINWQPAA